MNETLERKKIRVYGRVRRKLRIHECLEELNRIFLSPIIEADLMDALKTYDFIKECRDTELPYIIRNTIDFNKKEPILKAFVNISTLDCPFYVDASFCGVCGLLYINSIKNFNINFKWNDEQRDMIEFIKPDKSIHILLDYYEEDDSRLLDIIIRTNKENIYEELRVLLDNIFRNKNVIMPKDKPIEKRC